MLDGEEVIVLGVAAEAAPERQVERHRGAAAVVFDGVDAVAAEIGIA